MLAWEGCVQERIDASRSKEVCCVSGATYPVLSRVGGALPLERHLKVSRVVAD